MADAQYYTPKQNVERQLEDGRLIQAAVAGVPVLMANAIREGLIPDEELKGIRRNPHISAELASLIDTLRPRLLRKRRRGQPRT